MRMIKATFVLALALLGGCFIVPRHAAGSGWVELGDRWVESGNDHDTIWVGKATGRYYRIQVAVDSAPLEMFDMVVTFGNGQQWRPGTRLVFDAGTATRQIDLPGGARAIRRVDFRYGDLVAGARAHVVLYGL